MTMVSATTRAAVRGRAGWLLGVLLLLSGCAHPRTNLSTDLLSQLQPPLRVAVAAIAEEGSGDLTLLGDYLRDRVEAALNQRGLEVKPRKDLGRLIDDVGLTGGDIESRLWQQAGAEVVISGSYLLVPREDGSDTVSVRLRLKALSAESVSLVDTDESELGLARHLLAGLARKTGNIHQNSFRSVVGDGSDRLVVTGSLDRPSRCYRPGETITVSARTEPGVHLYLFSLSCDGNVTLLYPNSYQPDLPLNAADFQFPPKSPGNVQGLRVQQAVPGESCRESFKLVASSDALDFSYLPFPENRVYQGVNGMDITRLQETIELLPGIGELLLDYTIDAGCRKK